MNRNSNTDWLDLYKRRRRALARILFDERPNAKLLENGARLLLEAHYVGPWRMIWALFKREARESFEYYFGRRSRTVNRVIEEEEAIAEMVREL